MEKYPCASPVYFFVDKAVSFPRYVSPSGKENAYNARDALERLKMEARIFPFALNEVRRYQAKWGGREFVPQPEFIKD